MTSASSMNHEIVKKSIKNQSKQRKDNGDVLKHTKHPNQAATFHTLRPLIPSNLSNISTTIKRRSFWFHALSCVIIALCCLPSIASENVTQQLPLQVYVCQIAIEFPLQLFVPSHKSAKCCNDNRKQVGKKVSRSVKCKKEKQVA